jgi:hypothetical protein
MKAAKLFGLLSVLAVLSGTRAQAATSIGVEFLGRDGSGASGPTGNNPTTPGVGPNDTAGIVPQQFWNLVDDFNGSIGQEKGETPPLLDSAINTTTVTLLFDCNDSWYNDVTPTNITKPNAHLMNGIIKSSAGGRVPGVFTFTNVPEGQYDLYVYTDMNGDGVIGKFWDFDNLTTYYAKLQHQFVDTNTFVQGTATDLATATAGPAINYLKFSNLGTYGRGAIGVLGQWVSGGDGIGIAALQLVSAGPPQPNTNAVSFLTQPVNRRGLLGDSNVTFTASARGSAVTYQWYVNGAAIPGATGSSYTPAPIDATNNGAAYSVIASNNVNSVVSTNAILAVGTNVSVPGILETLWFGATRATIEDGSHDSISPDVRLILPTFSSPEEQGDNFGERVQCLFTPPANGNYVFFITSDDDSDLFLSTDSTPANKKLIAQETNWSNPFEWVSDAGGGSVTQKRSDKWSPDGGATVPGASGYTLSQGTQYYIEAVHHEGGGGDKVDVTYKLTSDPDPTNGQPSRITSAMSSHLELNGGLITVSQQPQGAQIAQGNAVTLSVTAKASYIGDASGAAPALLYQWQSAPQGSSTFTDIGAAVNSSYTTPLLTLADNGKQFRVHLTAADAVVNSAVAVVAVVQDTNPPVILGSGALAGSTQVGVSFNKAIDPVTGANAANYKVDGVAATGATVLTNNPPGEYLVQLTVASAVNANFNLTINGVKDAFGNALNNASFAGTALNLTSTDIGSADGQPGGPDPLVPTFVNVSGPGAVEVLANGNDYWNNADGFSFVWEPKTNSFDVAVRVVSVQNVNQWSAGAIEVREGPPTPNGAGWELARHYFCKVDYGGPAQALDNSGTGANTYEFNCRVAPGDDTLRETANSGPGESYGNWNTGVGGSGLSPVPFPNAWIRLARERNADGSSDHLLGYTSTDGVNWKLQENADLNDANHAGWTTIGGTNAGPWPTVCYVGMGTTSHTGIGNNNATNNATGMPYQCWVVYRNFGDTQIGGTQPTLSFTHNANGSLTLTYSGHLYSSTTVNGTYSTVPAAVSPYTVTPQASGSAAATFYRAGP